MDVIEAVKAGDMGALRGALEGASPDARTSDGTSALRLAIYLSRADAVGLLRAAGATLDAGDAAALGDVALLRRLVAEDGARLLAAGPDGFPPLHLAAHFGRIDALVALLDMGAPVGHTGAPPLRNTPLHAAAAGRQQAAMRALLDRGAPVSARDASGNTPLHVAAASGDVACCMLLLSSGASAQARADDGRTPADVALARGMAKAAALLQRPA